jgi:hypothetical protein
VYVSAGRAQLRLRHQVLGLLARRHDRTLAVRILAAAVVSHVLRLNKYIIAPSSRQRAPPIGCEPRWYAISKLVIDRSPDYL